MAGNQPSTKVFQCPSCGGGVAIRALGQTISVVCQSCGAVLDATDENYRVLLHASQTLKTKPVIPLGKRGKLRGFEWEVIGFMRRAAADSSFEWDEYLLFNPARGFRWLTHANGHWNYVVMLKGKPTIGASLGLDFGREVARYHGKSYQLFDAGTATVQYVVGEFYWRVRTGDQVETRDYVMPPEILSQEKTAEEEIWSLGTYLELDELRRGFGLGTLPAASGVAPNQPSAIGDFGPEVLKAWWIFFYVLIGIQALTYHRAHNEEVLHRNFQIAPSEPRKILVTESFELKHGPANLDLELHASVENSWLETQLDLVNDSTGEVYELEQGVEYYYGYDSDGSWQEGSHVNHLTVSAIPDGRYHLNVEPNGPVTAAPPTFTFTVRRDVVTWWNFFTALFLVSLFPAVVWLRTRAFEMARWSQSDYSPYITHQEENQ